MLHGSHPSTNATTPARSNTRILQRLVSEFLRPAAGGLTLALACIMLAAACTAGIAAAIKPMLDYVFVQKQTTLLLPAAVLIVGMLLVRELATFGQVVLTNRITRRVASRIQERLFAAALCADMS